MHDIMQKMHHLILIVLHSICAPVFHKVHRKFFFIITELCWYINKVWILNYYIITVSMPMKTVFNITNYKIKPEEILELLRKLKTSCDLGFPLQSATWLAGFPPKHSLTFYLLHKYTFLAYKYQSLRTLILTLSVTSPIYTVSWY